MITTCRGRGQLEPILPLVPRQHYQSSLLYTTTVTSATSFDEYNEMNDSAATDQHVLALQEIAKDLRGEVHHCHSSSLQSTDLRSTSISAIIVDPILRKGDHDREHNGDGEELHPCYQIEADDVSWMDSSGRVTSCEIHRDDEGDRYNDTVRQLDPDQYHSEGEKQKIRTADIPRIPQLQGPPVSRCSPLYRSSRAIRSILICHELLLLLQTHSEEDNTKDLEKNHRQTCNVMAQRRFLDGFDRYT
jgi:hypothetical protein